MKKYEKSTCKIQKNKLKFKRIAKNFLRFARRKRFCQEGNYLMSVNTSNVYGKISISDLAIAKVAANAALECYGIVDTVSRRFTDTMSELLKKQSGKGVKVVTSGDRIFIDVYVVIKYGVSINAVAESLKEGIKYKVEKFTGMIVDTVNVNIIGVKL